jgi:CHASE2 domain-containing sensor protein
MLRKLLLESFLATILVFGVMGVFVALPLNLDALQPIESAISNFDMMDIYYSKLNANEGKFSKNVVIVNIGDANREEIGNLIDFISIGNPAAVGVDVFFEKPKNSYQDTILSNAIHTNPNVVMAAYVDESKGAYIQSDSLFQSGHSGFTNFIGADARYSTIRYFRPKVEHEQAFSVALSNQADSSKTNAFLASCNNKQAINYIGNYDSFLMFEKDEVLGLEVDPEVFNNKVVLLGYLGKRINDQYNIEDRLYTPLNERISGRSVPDMNGVVIHANIIEMILANNWITLMPNALKAILSIVITYLHVLLFMFLIVKWDLYFDAWAKVLQVVSTLILLYLVFMAYHYFNYRIYITPSLVVVALAVDVLFVYEALANIFYKRFKIKSVLID